MRNLHWEILTPLWENFGSEHVSPAPIEQPKTCNLQFNRTRLVRLLWSGSRRADRS